MKILSLGDCNTLGVGPYKCRGYVEAAASVLDMSTSNCGITMSSTREGVHLIKDHMSPDVGLVTIQFGLVDSWSTFKYSPYVLYYPDGSLRKVARKIVKKYKKLCRRFGLNELLGERILVPPDEYIRNIELMLEIASPVHVVLIDTVPNKDCRRNAAIQRYNSVLDSISSKYDHVSRLRIYDFFAENMDRLYHDSTHINGVGHDEVSKRLISLTNQIGIL